MKAKIEICFITFFLVFIAQIQAANAVVGSIDFDAVKDLGDKVAVWWKKLPDPKPKSVALLPVSVSQNLNENFAKATEAIMMSKLAADGVTRVMVCQECRVPKLTVKDDRILVTKGVPSHQVLVDFAKSLEVESFLTLVVTKTAINMLVTAALIEPVSDVVIAARTFSVPNVTLSDSGMQFMLAAGLQFEVTPEQQAIENAPVPIGFNFTWLEQVGQYTKVGLNVGGIFWAQSGGVGYLQPQLGWKIRFGRSAFSLLPSLQAGFGFRSVTDLPTIGITAGTTVDLFLGQIFFVGAKVGSFIPLHNREVSKISVYPGFHVGFSLGR